MKKIVVTILSRRADELRKIDCFKDAVDREYEQSGDFCFVQIGANDGIKLDDPFAVVAACTCRGIVAAPLSF